MHDATAEEMPQELQRGDPTQPHWGGPLPQTQRMTPAEYQAARLRGIDKARKQLSYLRPGEHRDLIRLEPGENDPEQIEYVRVMNDWTDAKRARWEKIKKATFIALATALVIQQTWALFHSHI